MLANSHTESSEMGEFSTQLLHYAEKSLLKSHSVDESTHFAVPVGNGATSAISKVLSILRLKEKGFKAQYGRVSALFQL